MERNGYKKLTDVMRRSSFDIINSASDLDFFHNCSLKGGIRTGLERINNV